VRNPTTEFQLGVIRDAGPEITNGLGAFTVFAAIIAWLRPDARDRSKSRHHQG
jgi:hypothetical protein